ncbi:MAG: AI-2E family transporter [Planctomycetota bacterium]
MRDLLGVAVLIALLWLGHALRAVTVPLLVALLLAYLFEPVVSKLSSRRRVSRPLVVGGVLVTVGVMVVALLALVIPVIGTQTVNLVRDYQEGRFREAVVELSSNLPETWHEHADRLIRYLPVGGEPPDGAAPDPSRGAAGGQGDTSPAAGRDEETARIRAIVREELERAADAAGGAERPTSDSQRFLGLARGGARAVGAVLGGILQLGFLAFLIPFYFFFFSVSYPAVVNFAGGLVPEANRPRTFELLGKMDRVVAGFVRGRIVISLIMGVMLAVGWWICQVPYAITLGLVVGVFCAVPYLGVVGIPLAVGLLFFGQLGGGGQPTVWLGWWGVVLWPTVVFAVVQVIEGYALTPLIAGKATNLDPVTIVVAVLAGGSIMGVYGMLLAIPAAACIKIVCTDVLLPRIRAWTKGESADPLPIDRDD